MKITKEVLEALKKAVNKVGSQLELGNKCKLPHQYINQYMSGKVKGISLENWQKLYPCIKEYLPDNAVFLEGNGMIGNLIQNGGNNSIRTKGNVTNNINKTRDDYKSDMLKKILNNDDLTAEEKVKMLKLLDE